MTICLEPGCNAPRYRTDKHVYSRCEQHMKAFWRSGNRGAPAHAPVARSYQRRNVKTVAVVDYTLNRIQYFRPGRSEEFPPSQRELARRIERLEQLGVLVAQYPSLDKEGS